MDSTGELSPVERYETIRSSYKLAFVVFYRGSWCPFCQIYLGDLQSLTERIRAAGGHVVAVTAEAESELPKMRAASGYRGEVIVDPENLLAQELKRRGVIDVALTERKGYPHGVAQPAVLVDGPLLGGIMFKWAIVPGMMNFGGAKDRPLLTEVWDNVNARLQGKPNVHGKLGSMSFGYMLKHKLWS